VVRLEARSRGYEVWSAPYQPERARRRMTQLRKEGKKSKGEKGRVKKGQRAKWGLATRCLIAQVRCLMKDNKDSGKKNWHDTKKGD